MVSAGGENTAVRIDGLKSGADAIISKPIEQEEFIAFVKVMLRIKEAEDRLKRRNEELELTEIDLKKSLKQISEYQDSLKQLNNERAISEEKERRRIAEYLHDGLGQNLSLVNLRLTALLNSELDPKTEKSIRETADLVNQAINETRSLTYDLCPPILYELGLVPAISWKLSEIEKKYQINTILEKNAEETKISINKKVLLYRVVSELLNNILKHAGADLIQVTVSEIEDKFYISVIDNGTGFNGGEHWELTAKGSFGLFSIRERLDSIGGSLVIESENFTGTKVTIEIPL
jgi:signal transduction histidine kinase